MTVNAYVLGNVIRLTSTFTVSGVATDPTTVKCTTRDPFGTETVYTYAGATITRDSVGVYHVDITPGNKFGYWGYRFEATGTAASASEAQFELSFSPF